MPITDRILGAFGYERKSAPQDRPAFGGSSYWNWHSDTDHKADKTSLDNSSLIMAIVNWTGINLAEALPVVFKPDAKGIPQIDIGNPAADLIRRPNPFFTWADYCQAGAFDWWMGDWYMQKVRDGAGDLIELWYIPKIFITPRWPNDGKSPEVPANETDESNQFLTHYQYDRPGKPPILIKQSEMVHIKHGVNVSNPREGVCAWEPVLTEVYGDNAVARFSATIMQNMGMVQYLLSPKDKDITVSPTQAQQIKEQWIKNSTGANANSPMVNPVGIEATKMSFSPQELDLKELRKEPQSRVAGVAGVPAILLQYLVGLEHGHYGAAYEQARQQGYESVIIPIQNHISEDLTWQVLPELDQTKGAKFGFDITKVRVLQEDRDNLYRRESDALRSGGITINQFLTSVGKEPLPSGDIYLVPSMSNPMTADKLIERANAESQPPPPIDPASLAKFADIDRMFEGLEREMQEFIQNEKNAVR